MSLALLGHPHGEEKRGNGQRGNGAKCSQRSPEIFRGVLE